LVCGRLDSETAAVGIISTGPYDLVGTLNMSHLFQVFDVISEICGFPSSDVIVVLDHLEETQMFFLWHSSSSVSTKYWE